MTTRLSEGYWKGLARREVVEGALEAVSVSKKSTKKERKEADDQLAELALKRAQS